MKKADKKVLDEMLREDLRQKMLDYDSKARDIRQEIAKLDRENLEKERKKLIGKCFRLNGSESKSYQSWHGYFRVERLDETNLSPVGTKVINWNDEVNEKSKPGEEHIEIEINHETFIDWITNGELISNKKFEAMLKAAVKKIKI